MDISIYNPKTMGPPLSHYSQVARAEASEMIFIAGQVATDLQGRSVGKGDFETQMKQGFENIRLALESADATFANVVTFTTYLVKAEDIAHFWRVRETLFPKLFPNGAYPPNTLLVVNRLVHEDFLIEIQTIAVR
jgi:enamine deaminase RidA (YjgF/YER057c/UK114 family)